MHTRTPTRIAALALLTVALCTTSMVSATAGPGDAKPDHRAPDGWLGTIFATDAAPELPRSEEVNRTQEPCPSEHVCFYPEPNYGGTPEAINPDNLPACGSTPPAGSIANFSRETYAFFGDSLVPCSNHLGDIGPGEGWPILSEPVLMWA